MGTFKRISFLVLGYCFVGFFMYGLFGGEDKNIPYIIIFTSICAFYDYKIRDNKFYLDGTMNLLSEILITNDDHRKSIDSLIGKNEEIVKTFEAFDKSITEVSDILDNSINEKLKAVLAENKKEISKLKMEMNYMKKNIDLIEKNKSN